MPSKFSRCATPPSTPVHKRVTLRLSFVFTQILVQPSMRSARQPWAIAIHEPRSELCSLPCAHEGKRTQLHKRQAGLQQPHLHLRQIIDAVLQKRQATCNASNLSALCSTPVQPRKPKSWRREPSRGDCRPSSTLASNAASMRSRHLRLSVATAEGYLLMRLYIGPQLAAGLRHLTVQVQSALDLPCMRLQYSMRLCSPICHSRVQQLVIDSKLRSSCPPCSMCES